jgi:glutamate dehydrogenase (NAD(P)+)
VGAWVARLLAEQGGKVVAVSDVTGATRNRHGLDLKALDQHVLQTKGVKGFAHGDDFAPEQLLFEACDVLVPAALGNVLHKDNAREVRAKLILEGANHPVDPEADKVFAERGITVLPDIYANAGGVTFRWDEERVNAELKRVMALAWRDLRDTAKQHNCDLRTAAFALAIGRVAQATDLRGV